MPTKTAVSTTTTMETVEPLRRLPGLQFKEPLSWRAGKPIAITDLLRRLQELTTELRTMEQEECNRESFSSVARELASPNLLGHKDKGVKAWTACCLVEILRLCAPDAPYTGQQLRDVFNMIITSILPALADPSNAYHQQHLHVLNSLAQVKSVVLLTDIPSSEPLMIHLFATFFDVLEGSAKLSTGEPLAKGVEYSMTSILVTIVDESASLPSEVVDALVAQFLRIEPRTVGGVTDKNRKNAAAVEQKQSILVLKELPPAYNMAKTVCKTCPEKMARYISQYFNDVIVDASSSSAAKATSKRASHRRVSDDLDDSDLDIGGGPAEEDFKELSKVHQLLRELWRACPTVLQNVIPQLEAELSAENVNLRSMATETFGDIISGIGRAGLPPSLPLDPAAYPPISLSDTAVYAHKNVLTKPSSPELFSQVHPQAYASFLGRCHDKSPIVRSAWTTGVGRILTTSAGGVGLGRQEEERLIGDIAKMLGDADERVRIAAVKVVGSFSFPDLIVKLGAFGGLTKSGSVLATLAERVRDRKHAVRVEAMTVLARLWGVAVGSIAAGDEQIISVIGAAPSIILDTYYTNDVEIWTLLDHVMFEQLLPLSYPPKQTRSAKLAKDDSQKAKDRHTNGYSECKNIDHDKIRTERILLLVRDLDERAKKVFFALQGRQITLAQLMTTYLQRCENYNGGVMEAHEKDIEEHMNRLIESWGKLLPDPSKVSEVLWKFAKMHDRRNYQLIRFCMDRESEYGKVVKAFKEITKRIEQSTTTPQDLLNVMVPILYRVSVLVCNKSHVPAIMEYSRTDEKSLAGAAHEMLKDISTRSPVVLKAHVQEICTLLQDEAPNTQKTNEPGAVDNLEACASYASKYAKEIPRDRKFIQAMTNFALYGTPPKAAKYAVTILMTASDKKEMIAKDLVNKCLKDFEYGADGFVSRLATLSQLMLLAPNQVIQEADAVNDIAISEILLQVRNESAETPDSYEWSPTVNPECDAKCWALKILVNRVRSHPEQDTLSEVAEPVYKLLTKLITDRGECSPSKNTPSTYKPRLRLLAARLCLKLCQQKHTDALFPPTAFNSLALMAQDTVLHVRTSFLQRLKKYLGQTKLPSRFYTIPFLLAFEPSTTLKSDTTTWIRSCAAKFYALKEQDRSSKTKLLMESIFARLLSLLAHHPDYSSTAEDLTDFARYILFYLHPVATEENLSLIYHIAQRVKQARDAITPSAEYNDNLYHLSDLAQLTIRKFEEAQGWNIQTMPIKVHMPHGLFTEIRDHGEAQKIAEKNHLPEGVEEAVESLVRASMRSARSNGKKRKSEGDENGEERGSKRTKQLAIRKAPAKEKKAKVSGTSKMPKTKKRKSDEEAAPSERRRSGRANVTGGKYAERDDEQDDEEMADGVVAWEYEDGSIVNEDGEVIDEEETNGAKELEEEEAEEKQTTPKPSPKGKNTAGATKGKKCRGK